MAAARSIVLLIIVVGGLMVAACAPPTPKVGSLIIPQVMEKESSLSVNGPDGSIKRKV